MFTRKDLLFTLEKILEELNELTSLIDDVATDADYEIEWEDDKDIARHVKELIKKIEDTKIIC